MKTVKGAVNFFKDPGKFKGAKNAFKVLQEMEDVVLNANTAVATATTDIEKEAAKKDLGKAKAELEKVKSAFVEVPAGCFGIYSDPTVKDLKAVWDIVTTAVGGPLTWASAAVGEYLNFNFFQECAPDIFGCKTGSTTYKYQSASFKSSSRKTVKSSFFIGPSGVYKLNCRTEREEGTGAGQHRKQYTGKDKCNLPADGRDSLDGINWKKQK